MSGYLLFYKNLTLALRKKYNSTDVTTNSTLRHDVGFHNRNAQKLYLFTIFVEGIEILTDLMVREACALFILLVEPKGYFDKKH